MINENLTKKIILNALSLEDELGIYDLAWTRENAIQMINSIRDDDIIILGGDVYKKEIDNIQSLGDNWYCDPKNDEKRVDYAKRSKDVALEYIEKYPVKLAETILFGVVFDQQVFI